MTSYIFDDAFQDKVVAMLLRDEPFLAQTEGLIQPEYFEDQGRAYLSDFAVSHYNKYRQSPSRAVMLNELKARKASKLISDDLMDSIKSQLAKVFGKPDLSNREYTVECVEKFAQKRAVEDAIMTAAGKLDKGATSEELRPILTQALDVGASKDLGSGEFMEDLERRTQARVDAMSGLTTPNGVTTGVREIDKETYHGGWGKGELSCIMGPPKGGKSIGLINFATNAAKAGHNVLAVTLEVSYDITTTRMDSCLTGLTPKEVKSSPAKVKAGLLPLKGKMGLLCTHEFPTGSFRPMDLRRLIRRYEAQSIKFDLIVVDYADIMAPDHWDSEERERSRQVYISLRALAQEECVAVLTATQTNRAGSTRNTSKKEDVAEDFNKVRLVDIMFSINFTPEERKDKMLRLYVVAARNGDEGFAFHCKTDYSRMKFIEKVLKIE